MVGSDSPGGEPGQAADDMKVQALGAGTGALRRRRWVTAGMAAVLLAAPLCRPRYQTVTVAGGRQYDVIRYAVDAGIGGMFGPPAVDLGPALVVHYYAPDEGRTAPALEEVDIVGLGSGEASRRGLRLLVLQRETPVGSRWLPLKRATMRAYARGEDGDWRPARQRSP